jgi:hypothetical protein
MKVDQQFEKGVTQSADGQWREVKEMGEETLLLSDCCTAETCKDRRRRNRKF